MIGSLLICKLAVNIELVTRQLTQYRLSLYCYIGNDQCASCIDVLIPLLTPQAYGKHVTAAIERIRRTVPRVLINLSKSLQIASSITQLYSCLSIIEIVGTFNVTQVYTVTKGQSYCMPFQHTDFIFNSIECPCAIDTKYRPKMDQISAGMSN